ncbi:MAG TPA: alpha/beta hydrolase [Isosphaeraceae bacterium]
MIRQDAARSISAIALGILITILPSIARSAEPEEIPLWPAGAPGAVGTEARDIPTLTIFRPDPDKATGASVVICPGGGYGFLAVEHEGAEVGKWLNSLGVTGFMLKYRIAPRYRHPAPIQDANRAIRTVRARASEWGLDPHRIAILGFSAGGHLASTAGTHYDAGKPDDPDAIERGSSRPDRMILVYPVIAISTEFGHTGSRDNLLGKGADKALVQSLSNETQVTKDTPPTFLAQTNADAGVPAENALLFTLALRKNKVPVELHVFEKGVHGLGLGSGWAGHIPPEPSFQAWPGLCATWLKNKGFLDKK